jgi:hypothetical protein
MRTLAIGESGTHAGSIIIYPSQHRFLDQTPCALRAWRCLTTLLFPFRRCRNGQGTAPETGICLAPSIIMIAA